MITKKLLKQFDLTDINAYFDMIIESKVNGQHQQMKNQIDCMNKSEKKLFISLLIGNGEQWDQEAAGACIAYIIEVL